MSGTRGAGHLRLPEFLRPLARRAASGADVLASPAVPVPEGFDPRRSAVLLLLAGRTVDEAALLLEERAHTMRSQPGQFALPGGGVEPEDADDAAAALRETHEETGLAPEDVRVLGAFAPIPMPWRSYSVRPVLAWAPARPVLPRLNPDEVESVRWASLRGPGSLSDPAVRGTGRIEQREVGPVFDLPGEAFVWGFTAMIVAAVLEGLGLPGPQAGRAILVPHRRRRTGP